MIGAGKSCVHSELHWIILESDFSYVYRIICLKPECAGKCVYTFSFCRGPKSHNCFRLLGGTDCWTYRLLLSGMSWSLCSWGPTLTTETDTHVLVVIAFAALVLLTSRWQAWDSWQWQTWHSSDIVMYMRWRWTVLYHRKPIHGIPRLWFSRKISREQHIVALTNAAEHTTIIQDLRCDCVIRLTILSKDTLFLSLDLGRGWQMQSELPACGRYCFLLPIAGHEKFLARDTKKRVAHLWSHLGHAKTWMILDVWCMSACTFVKEWRERGGGPGRAKNANPFRAGPKLRTARGSGTSVGKA